MIKLKTSKKRLSVTLTVIIVLLGIIFFLLRGPYLSNSIKRKIIPVLENVTRERIIIDKAVINLFPFYVQAKGFKVFDKEGNRLLWVTKMRTYIDLLGLFSKEIRIRKLTLKEPDLTAGEADVKRVLDNIRQSSSVGEKGKYTVSLKNIELNDGNVKFGYDNNAITLSGTGLFVNMTTKKSGSLVHVMMKDGTVKLPNASELQGGIEGRFTIADNGITVSKIDVYSSKSRFEAQGSMKLASDGRIEDGSFNTHAKIDVETLNRIFALKQKKDGVVNVEGTVTLLPDESSQWPRFSLDLKTDSTFYLETLMELIDVQDRITGKVSLEGKITGIFPELTGNGDGKIVNAVFDTLPIDDAAGHLTFIENTFSLNNFTVRTFDGTLAGDADITLPDGDYSLTAHMSDISSTKLFRYLEWEAPFQEGKVSGDVFLSKEHDRDIFITADLKYFNSTKSGEDILGRLDTISTALELKDDILVLENTEMATSQSTLFLDGNIDFNTDSMDLDIRLDSANANDLTAPDYTKVTAPVRFTGKGSGPLDDPLIAGRVEAESGSIHGMQFSNVLADVTYRIRSLDISELRIRQEKALYDISGAIDFRASEDLFSFKDPFYKAKGSIKNADIVPFIALTDKDIPVTGHADGMVSFEGNSDEYKAWADMVISNGTVYDQPFDIVNVKATLYPDNVEFHLLDAYRGESSFNAQGSIFYDGKYEFALSSEKLRFSDFPAAVDKHVGADIRLHISGAGTLKKPELNFSMMIEDSRYRDIHIGQGMIIGTLKDKDLLAQGSFVDGKVTADAKAVLGDKIPWSVDFNLKKGNYDFVLMGLLPDSPRDLTVSLEGDISVSGLDSDVSMETKLDSLNISLYGYSFRNKEPVVMNLEDEKYTVRSFILVGENADLSLSGSMNLNRDYRLLLKGSMSMVPLRALSDKLETLRGRGQFIVNVTGPWKNPEFVGEITILDATASLSDFAYKIGPVNGTIYMQKDRFTFNDLSALFSGGDIRLSGAGYFEEFSVNRFYLSSDMNNIRIRPAEGISTVMDGKLFYERSENGSSLTGDIKIDKAKYEKRIEWKSWLLGFKEIQHAPVDYPAFLSETDLNIRLSSDRIFIDNNIARTPVKMSLNVTGTPGKFGLIGRMEASEGSIYFRSNEFNILEGSSVDFIKPNGIEPMLHIIADTYTSDYYVRLSIDGTIDKFALTLYSDPPLTESEILALLTFGQVEKESRGIESGIAAGEATALLTGTLQDKVEAEFKFITGIERFEIEPHTTQQGGFSPKVTLGKRLLDDQIFVTYSSTVGTVEEQTINIEYKLDRNLSVIGSRNEIGSAGVDFKYRFEFK